MNNEVQYCNRMTASVTLDVLKRVGFKIDKVDIQLCDITRAEIHPDHRWQSDEDLRAVRMNLVAYK